jgi:hypothetical protein
MGASAPPAIIASASPRWISRNASPIECVPVAQAVTTHELGPRAPKRIETTPDAMFVIMPGMKNGETRLAPRSRSVAAFSSIACSPPMPEPISTPTRSARSGSTRRAAWSIACCAAAIV